ncbi:MAG: phosphatase PAP2 family protein [Bacteroidales bacterium]|jgi:undecaprenyl-diphosphatase|nr:phosphatase PAP2 family protein [Bacteroidales bacterium]
MHFATLDFALLYWLNHNFIPHSVPVLQLVSYTTTFISIAMVLIVLIISIVKRSKSIRKQFYILALVLILVALVSQGLKQIIFRERPFSAHPSIEKLSQGGGSSFPSGHSLEAFAIATSLSLLFKKKKIVIPLFIWAMLVAYSRMALGVHYPSDVVGGIIIGILIGWSVQWAFNRFNSKGANRCPTSTCNP